MCVPTSHHTQKQTEDINIRATTTKLLEGNVTKTFVIQDQAMAS